MATHRAAYKGQKVAFPLRGEIYLVSFDPTVGSEIQKTRPALVIQNDIGNQYSPITIVAAITSKSTSRHTRLKWSWTRATAVSTRLQRSFSIRFVPWTASAS
jgi:mRNA-degrading endonuclease toxin of MazEF toxin-antitoxin module